MVNFLLGHIIDVTIFYCRGKYPSIFCHIVFKIYCIKILKGSNYHHPYLSHSTFQTDNHQKGLAYIFWYKLLMATSICSHKLNEFVLTKNCLDKILTFQSGYWKMKWFWIHECMSIDRFLKDRKTGRYLNVTSRVFTSLSMPYKFTA